MKTFKVIALAAAMVMVGATAALAAVNWPAKTSTFNGVNNYLNALHQTDLNQFSQAKVVSAPLTPSGDGSSERGSVDCPGGSATSTGWYATGGGVLYSTSLVNHDYYVVESGPATQMGGTQPNAWMATVSDPIWNGTDPLPTNIRVYAVCVT